MHQLDELEFIIAQAKALNSRANELGFELTLTALSQPLTVATQTKSPRRNKGTSNYWKLIAEIAEKRGITNGEARELYKAEKDKGNDPNKLKQVNTGETKKRVSPVTSKRIRKARKNYWSEINQIKSENDCDVKEARQIYRDRKAA